LVNGIVLFTKMYGTDSRGKKDLNELRVRLDELVGKKLLAISC